MRKLILLIFITISFSQIFADEIIKKDGTKIIGTIISASKTAVKIKYLTNSKNLKFTNVISVNKDEIFKYIFSNSDIIVQKSKIKIICKVINSKDGVCLFISDNLVKSLPLKDIRYISYNLGEKLVLKILPETGDLFNNLNNDSLSKSEYEFENNIYLTGNLQFGMISSPESVYQKISTQNDFQTSSEFRFWGGIFYKISQNIHLGFGVDHLFINRDDLNNDRTQDNISYTFVFSTFKFGNRINSLRSLFYYISADLGVLSATEEMIGNNNRNITGSTFSARINFGFDYYFSHDLSGNFQFSQLFSEIINNELESSESHHSLIQNINFTSTQFSVGLSVHF